MKKLSLKQPRSSPQSCTHTWQRLPMWVHWLVGLVGSSLTLLIFWQLVLLPLDWPTLPLVLSYVGKSALSSGTYIAMLMTGLRALLSMVIGFGLALGLAILTGQTIWGWCAFFVLLLILQKIPAIAMVHVFVSSKLGIGFAMTIALASTVIMTFTWMILHHRAQTFNAREVFPLRVLGWRGVQLSLNGLLPHMGSAIGGAARLAMSIAIIMVVLGEWQGVWADGSWWSYGLGVQISRYYDAIDSQARVLANCLWLGILGLFMDALVQGTLRLSRVLTGVELRR